MGYFQSKKITHSLIASLLFFFLLTPTKAEIVSDENVDLRPYFFPVRNQLGAGACVFFALTSAMESFPGVPPLSESRNYLENLFEKNKTQPKNTHHNEQAADGTNLERIHHKIEKQELTVDNDHGRNSFDYLVNEILPPLLDQRKVIEPEWETAKFNSFLLLKDLNGILAQSKYLQKTSRFGGKTVQSVLKTGIYVPTSSTLYKRGEINSEIIKNHLRNKQPVLVNLKIINAKWFNHYFNHNPIYSKLGDAGDIQYEPLIDNAVTDPALFSFHTILIVGFKTKITPSGKTTEFIFRNSYGKEWGKNGYGTIQEQHLIHSKHAYEALVIKDVKSQKQSSVSNDLMNVDYNVKIHIIPQKNGQKTAQVSLILYRNSTIPESIEVAHPLLNKGVPFELKSTPNQSGNFAAEVSTETQRSTTLFDYDAKSTPVSLTLTHREKRGKTKLQVTPFETGFDTH